jgi:hypothetical protein
MPQNPIPVTITNAAGNSIFVNAATGNDNNSGNPQAPFASLNAAVASAKANNNDVVYGIGTVHITEPLAWNKDGVSLVGLASPSDNDRFRISPAPSITQTQVTALAELVNVTGQGCSFINVGTFYGFDGVKTPPASAVAWKEAGGRNYYSNVQFLGGGDVLTAALAGMRSLTIAGNGENLFDGCTFGLDTVVRATNANATLELLAGTPRNRIRRSVFQSLCSDAADVHIHVGAAGMDRYLMLEGCKFINAVDSTATALTAAITADAAAGGSIILDSDCLSVGATLIAASGPVYGPIGALGATTWGLAGKLT